MANQISQSTIDAISLLAGAVPELPVVAWQGSSWAHSFISETARIGNSGAMWIADYTIDLTPRAPAQAIIHAQAAEIERLKRELAEMCEVLRTR